MFGVYQNLKMVLCYLSFEKHYYIKVLAGVMNEDNGFFFLKRIDDDILELDGYGILEIVFFFYLYRLTYSKEL